MSILGKSKIQNSVKNLIGIKTLDQVLPWLLQACQGCSGADPGSGEQVPGGTPEDF